MALTLICKTGTHGTSKSRALRIQSSSFRLSGSAGRAGSGVYFWDAELHGRKLAVAWHSLRFKQGEYKYDSEPNCSVIYTTLNFEKNRFLDLEDRKLKTSLGTLIEEKCGADMGKDKEVGALYDLFIKKLEEKLGSKLQGFGVTVALPGKQEDCLFYPVKALGSPYCYVIREINCIKIDNTEHVAA